MSKPEQLQEIIESYRNGQKKQMVEQITKVGLRNIIDDLIEDTSITTGDTLSIVSTYLKLTNS